MFPVTHLYFCSLMYPKSSERAIGAIFPDTNLLTGLRWSQTHKCSKEFLNKVTSKEKQDYFGFFQGYLSHAVDSYGLDYFGDEKYKDSERGYAYKMSESIIPDVVEVCKIPTEMGPWKAHNFIEMAIETIVAQENPEIGEWVEETIKDTKNISKIASLLSKYYFIDKDIFIEGISKFFNFVVISGEPLELAKSYQKVLMIRHQIEDTDSSQIASVILKAREIIEKEFMEFIFYCKDKFTENWNGVLI